MLNIREVLNGVKKYVDEVVNEAVSGSKCNGGGGSINYKKLENPMIKVIIGPRRAGKSFFSFHFSY